MKLDTINLIIILVMVIALVVGAIFYYKEVVNECTSQPFVYGAKQLTERNGYEFEGYGWFKVPAGVSSPSILFNSSTAIID